MSNQPPSEKKMSKYYPYKSLSRYEGLYGEFPCRAPTTYVGVEIELEKVKVISSLPSSVSITNDGSLKLDGKEFITVPIHFCYLEQELRRLFCAIKPPHVSQRCSIHVHLNARDFTHHELYRFVLLYLIFERSLFNFSGGRDNNIFCTPLYSYMPHVKKEVSKLVAGEGGIQYMSWHKYFALNLCPIWGGDEGKVLGTVEFRHMAGTIDTERIIEWINLIVSLKISAKKFGTDELLEHIKVMNTSSGYNWLVREVFREWCKHIVWQPTFKKDVEAGILAAKQLAFQQRVEEDAVEIAINNGGSQ